MTQITGCPAQGTGVQCYEHCQDARMAGESRLCKGTEFDPATITTLQMADAGLLDDSARSQWHIKGGLHAGHTAEVYSAKHNCGAYQIDVICSCGKTWENAMDGCWQNGHQRVADGDTELAL